jgi:hypothetical protein
MKTPLRAAVAAAVAGVATLAFASSALALDRGSLAVSQSPQALASTGTTTIHVAIQPNTPPIAAVNIYSGNGWKADLSGAAGSQIGTVDATAFSRDNNLTLPLSGTITVSDPSAAANAAGSAQCTGLPKSAAVWIMNLSVAGQTLEIPMYVNETTGAPDQPLGGYRISVCLPPPDVPVGTPGRAFQGAQLLDAKLKLNKVFTSPTGGDFVKTNWEALFTPYNPGIGTVNRAGTFEARAFVPMPIILGLHVKYQVKTNTYLLNGKLTEGGKPVLPAAPVLIYRGLSPKTLKKRASTRSHTDGNWKTAGNLKPKKPTYFQIAVSRAERDYTAEGCTNPATAFAPAGCASATLSAWSAKSRVVKLSKLR